MRKVLSSFVLTVALIYGFICQGFAADLSSKTEALGNGKRAVSDTQHFENLKNLAARAQKKMNDAKKRSAAAKAYIDGIWVSEDPDDLAPLLGTTWEFTYGSSADTLEFGSTSFTGTDDSVMLFYYDQDGNSGAVVYEEFPPEAGGGYGFIAITFLDSVYRSYWFNLDGNTAWGYQADMDIYTEEVGVIHTLSGEKTDASDANGLFSSNPDDLKPLFGNIWEFTYTLSSTEYTDTLVFDTEVFFDEGDAALLYRNHTGTPGMVLYGGLPEVLGGGDGFQAITRDEDLDQYYFFKISGDTATGYWVGGINGEYTESYAMTGKKVGSSSLADEPAGYVITNDGLLIGAVINTEEKGRVEAIWKEGGRDETDAGDVVIWGHFYASSDDVSWGSPQNPDLFVKVWFDHNGRLDINFFHVSVPDIEVYSAYPYNGSFDEHDTSTTSRRYIRQYYKNGQSQTEEAYEDGNPPAGDFPDGALYGQSFPDDELWIGAIIRTAEKGPVEAVWSEGGQDVSDRGDKVIWGHFYASPSDVAWGNADNPDLFVKIWFDVSGRVDVNFFHVSVPDIEVYSDLPDLGDYDQA
ncbi:MAG: hypothetical protein B6245_17005, partial [Desulfobacteraceae bacterium 4572_88]